MKLSFYWLLNAFLSVFLINEPSKVNEANSKALIEESNLIQVNFSAQVAGDTLGLVLTCQGHPFKLITPSAVIIGLLYLIYHVLIWYCQKSHYIPETEILILHLQNLIYLGHSTNVHHMISAVLFYNCTPSHIVEKHATENYGWWLSERTKLGIWRNLQQVKRLWRKCKWMCKTETLGLNQYKDDIVTVKKKMWN